MAKSDYAYTQLKNGLGVLVKSIPDAVSVSAGVWVNTGGRYESPSHAGISHFIEHMVFKGTRRYTCEGLKQQIEGVGGSLNAFTAEEQTCYMVKLPARYSKRALNVLAEMVCHPRYSSRDLERERDVILEEILMIEDSPAQHVQELFQQLLWQGHPLGTLLSGTPKSVKAITRKHLTQYWKRHYQPKNMLVAVVGAVDAESINEQCEKLFGKLKPQSCAPFKKAPRPFQKPRSVVVTKTTEQTHLCLGTFAGSRAHPGRYAMELLNVVLGANMSSRLFREVRERRGLVYDIGSQIRRYQDAGVFLVSAGCDPSKLKETLKVVSAELREAKRGHFSLAELKRAKDYYAGQFWMGLEDTMEHMLWMGESMLVSNRKPDPEELLKAMNQVTMQDMKKYTQGLFKNKGMHLSIVGQVQQEEAEALLKKCQI